MEGSSGLGWLGGGVGKGFLSIVRGGRKKRALDTNFFWGLWREKGVGLGKKMTTT
jgi:hypothetical protein